MVSCTSSAVCSHRQDGAIARFPAGTGAPGGEMDDALVAALREASAPPDKAQLVVPLSSKLGRNVTAKEVNKALYALAGRGVVKQAGELHGEKPTWELCDKTPAPADDSDDEENRPLQPRAKRPKPKEAEIADAVEEAMDDEALAAAAANEAWSSR